MKFIPLVLFIISFLVISITIKDYGITWDEPSYMYAAKLHGEWFNVLKNSILTGNYLYPFSNKIITKYWESVCEHPPLVSNISFIFWSFFHHQIGDIKAYRLSGAFFFALLLTILYLFVSEIYSIKVGLISSLSLFFLPRIFGHSHFISLDLPIACMWFFTTYAFYKGLNSIKWSIFTGVLFGLALSTKINAFFIPIPLLL